MGGWYQNGSLGRLLQSKHLQRLRNTAQNFSKYGRLLVRYVNPRLPKYEAEVLTIQPLRFLSEFGLATALHGGL
jgi:hypothetical protein